MKAFVTLEAIGDNTVTIHPNDPSVDLITVNGSNCRMMGLRIENVTGIGAAAIRVTSAISPLVCIQITFVNCYENITVESTSTLSQAVLFNSRHISGAATSKFVKVTSSSGNPSVVRLFSGLCTEDNGTSFDTGLYLSGAGSRIDCNDLLVRSTTGAGNGITVRDGAEFVSQTGSEFEGFNKNLSIENVGANPVVRTTTIMLRNGVVADLQIDHPGAMGSIEAKANTSSKVFVNSSAPIKLILTDPASSNSTGIFIKGDILQADRFDRKANLSLIGREATTLGLLEGGGVLSVISGLQINISSGTGFLDDPTDIYLKQVSWPSTNITLTANSNNFIYIDTNSIVQVNSAPPDIEKTVYLGRVITRSSTVDFIEHSQMIMNHVGNKTQVLLRDGLGPIFGSGAIVTENVTPLKLDVTAGAYYYGTNLMAISGGSAISWESIYRDGGSDFTFGIQSTVDNSFYDDGTGTLAPLTSGYYAKHTLYVIGDNGDEKYFLVYSQAQYAALIDATNAPLPIVPSFIEDAVVRIAGIIVQQGAPNINSTIDLRPRLGFAAPATTAASDHGNLTGLLDDDHPQYLNRSGIRPMTGPLTSIDTTQSTNKDTGSIVTEGGLGVEKNINAGGNISSVGTLGGSNFSGSSSGANTGDVSVTDSPSIDLTLVGQNVKADVKKSADAADAGNIRVTLSEHTDGLHTQIPYDVPVQIGTSNSAGTGSKAAAFDHVHAATFGVIGSLLMSTYVLGTNAVLATTDSIVVAFGKVQAQINAILASAVTSLTGDVTGSGPGATATSIAVGAVTDTKSSLAVKPALTVVATTNQTLSGTPTIDGQATAAGTSTVLLTAQTTASENGPWVIQSGAWTRPTWYPTGGITQSFQFITCFIRLGTVYGGSTWRQTAAAPITIGTTSTTWVVTPVSGNYKTEFDIGPQSGSSDILLAFKNAFTGILSWNPTSNYTIKLPPTQGVAGSVPTNDGSGNLIWANPQVNIDGGTAGSVYTSGQIINGGTP